MRRVIFLLLAGCFFVLGALGAVLPVLPTTPFLLLTSYCLVRSSPRLNAALLRSRFFGPILTDWQQHGGVRWDVKARAVSAVLIAVGVSIYLSESSFWSTIAILASAAVGMVVICCLPRIKPQGDKSDGGT